LSAAARRAIWSLYPVAPLFSLVAKIGEAEEDAFLLEEGLRCDDLEVKQTAAVAMASLMQARHKLGSKVPALKVTQAMKRLAEALLNSDLEESIPAGMAGIFQLWADKDRPDSDDTNISEAAEVLLPFLNLDSEKDPVAVANGVQGWTALHVVAPCRSGTSARRS
jgi:hypothetical protein